MLEECRMVLPGIQALFGFQLIAVFSERFARVMGLAERLMHLAAIVFVAAAIAMIMAPAALHRRTDPHSVSQRYLEICSRLILASMVPLASAIVLETCLVANVLLQSPAASMACAGIVGAMFLAFWWGLPRAWRRRC